MLPPPPARFRAADAVTLAAEGAPVLEPLWRWRCRKSRRQVVAAKAITVEWLLGMPCLWQFPSRRHVSAGRDCFTAFLMAELSAAGRGDVGSNQQQGVCFCGSGDGSGQ